MLYLDFKWLRLVVFVCLFANEIAYKIGMNVCDLPRFANWVLINCGIISQRLHK